MRLGFYYHTPVREENGRIFMPGYFGRFLDGLAANCEKLLLFLHTPKANENANFDYALQGKNIELISLGDRKSVLHRTIHSKEYVSVIKQYGKGMDLLLVRGPTPLLPDLVKGVKPLPTALLLVGDYLAGVNSLPQSWWRKELIRIWSWYYDKAQLQAAKTSFNIVNSQVLYRQMEGKVDFLAKTHTTTLYESDFYIREDTCQSEPIRLLYTGRMDPAKGLLDIVEALAILVKQDENVVLDFVGQSEKRSTIVKEISQKALENNIADRVFINGYKPVGPELFDFYKKADIYVIASQSSFEGFPRTIWEAMAHCLPVVATKVSSIPDFVSGSAVLVDPMKPDDLASGISQVIHDHEFRRMLITKGMAMANENTLEKQVHEMIDSISNWLENHRE